MRRRFGNVLSVWSVRRLSDKLGEECTSASDESSSSDDCDAHEPAERDDERESARAEPSDSSAPCSIISCNR